MAVLIFLGFRISVWLGTATCVGVIAYILYNSMPSFYAAKGSRAFSEQKTDEARAWYEKAYKTGRASASIANMYGFLLLRCAMPEEAEKVFTYVILHQKKDAAAVMKAKQYRALVYYKTGREDEAYEDASELFESCRNTMSYSLLGYLMTAMQKPLEETLAFCREAYDYNSDERDIVDNLLVVEYRAKNFERAGELADELLAAHPEFTEAHYHGALAYAALGDNERAREALNGAEQCTRTYLTTVSEEEIAELKERLQA